jgi:hypothetical protein
MTAIKIIRFALITLFYVIITATGLLSLGVSSSSGWPAPQQTVIHDTTEIMNGDTAQFVALWNDSDVTLTLYLKIDTLGYDYLSLVRWDSAGSVFYDYVIDSLTGTLSPVGPPEPDSEFSFSLNPFNPGNEIQYVLPLRSHVRLIIYDVLGRLVETLVNDFQTAGPHQIAFDGSRWSSGLYFVQIHAGEYFAVKKMVMIK